MKKIRLLSLLVCLCVLSFFQIEKVFASNYQAEVTLKDGTKTQFERYQDGWDYADSNLESTIKMLSDWHLEGNTLKVGAAPFDHSKFTLDLNGYTIDGGASRIIHIDSGLMSTYLEIDELTIIDSSSKKTGTMTNGNAEFGGGIYVEGILNFNGGILKNCKGGHNGDGAGIYVSPITKSGIYITHPAGVLNIDGGKIENCSNAGLGGGIYLGNAGVATLKSGSITNCAALHKGGGLLVAPNAKVTMEKGFSITNCSVSDGIGGGVSVRPDGTFTMDGGKISGCSAEEGGGIFVEGSGGQIQGRFLDQGILYLHNGEIVNNTCTSKGGGVGTYGDASSTPANIYLGGNIRIYDNKKSGKQNNLFLDTATFEDDTTFLRMESELFNTIGISCEKQRRISGKSLYPSDGEHLVADDPNCEITYEPKDQRIYLVAKKPTPKLVSADIASKEDGSYTTYDQDNHIATVYIPRKFGDVEVVRVEWTGEKITNSDGSWSGDYTKSPIDVQFFTGFNINQKDQSILITNTNGKSVSWTLRIEEIKETLYVCNGSDENHKLDHHTESNNYNYYYVYPNEKIKVTADPAPEGQVFDCWKVNKASNIELGDAAFEETLEMKMPLNSDWKLGLKATYKEKPSVGFGLGNPSMDNPEVIDVEEPEQTSDTRKIALGFLLGVAVTSTLFVLFKKK